MYGTKPQGSPELGDSQTTLVVSRQVSLWVSDTGEGGYKIQIAVIIES